MCLLNFKKFNIIFQVLELFIAIIDDFDIYIYIYIYIE